MTSTMINPSISELLTKVDNRYSLVVITSKRARQLIDGEKKLVETDSIKSLTIAIEEVNSDAITYQTMKEGIK